MSPYTTEQYQRAAFDDDNLLFGDDLDDLFNLDEDGNADAALLFDSKGSDAFHRLFGDKHDQEDLESMFLDESNRSEALEDILLRDNAPAVQASAAGMELDFDPLQALQETQGALFQEMQGSSHHMHHANHGFNNSDPTLHGSSMGNSIGNNNPIIVSPAAIKESAVVVSQATISRNAGPIKRTLGIPRRRRASQPAPYRPELMGIANFDPPAPAPYDPASNPASSLASNANKDVQSMFPQGGVSLCVPTKGVPTKDNGSDSPRGRAPKRSSPDLFSQEQGTRNNARHHGRAPRRCSENDLSVVSNGGAAIFSYPPPPIVHRTDAPAPKAQRRDGPRRRSTLDSNHAPSLAQLLGHSTNSFHSNSGSDDCENTFEYHEALQKLAESMKRTELSRRQLLMQKQSVPVEVMPTPEMVQHVHPQVHIQSMAAQQLAHRVSISGFNSRASENDLSMFDNEPNNHMFGNNAYTEFSKPPPVDELSLRMNAFFSGNRGTLTNGLEHSRRQMAVYSEAIRRSSFAG